MFVHTAMQPYKNEPTCYDGTDPLFFNLTTLALTYLQNYKYNMQW